MRPARRPATKPPPTAPMIGMSDAPLEPPATACPWPWPCVAVSMWTKGGDGGTGGGGGGGGRGAGEGGAVGGLDGGLDGGGGEGVGLAGGSGGNGGGGEGGGGGANTLVSTVTALPRLAPTALSSKVLFIAGDADSALEPPPVSKTACERHKEGGRGGIRASWATRTRARQTTSRGADTGTRAQRAQECRGMQRTLVGGLCRHTPRTAGRPGQSKTSTAASRLVIFSTTSAVLSSFATSSVTEPADERCRRADDRCRRRRRPPSGSYL